MTEVKIKNKKIYLSPILDMFNGEIISYTISYHPDLNMAMSMLDKAFKKTNIPEGLILHSDQGWHYQHLRYQKTLKDKHIVQSMSRKGNCLDNAMMENFFGLMKSELLYLQEWDSIEQFAKELVKYIRYYNNDRIKLRLKERARCNTELCSNLSQPLNNVKPSNFWGSHQCSGALLVYIRMWFRRCGKVGK